MSHRRRRRGPDDVEKCSRHSTSYEIPHFCIKPFSLTISTFLPGHSNLRIWLYSDLDSCVSRSKYLTSNVPSRPRLSFSLTWVISPSIVREFELIIIFSSLRTETHSRSVVTPEWWVFEFLYSLWLLDDSFFPLSDIFSLFFLHTSSWIALSCQRSERR